MLSFDFGRKPGDGVDPSVKEIRDKLAVLLHYAMLQDQRVEMIMALADDLQSTVTAVKTSIDAAIAMLATLRTEAGTVPDATVTAAITELTASRNALDAAATPPPAG